MNWAKIGLFAAGVLFGTAGIKVLGSKDAKKVYTETTAAALRAKECVMTTVTTIKENANDILTTLRRSTSSALPMLPQRSSKMQLAHARKKLLPRKNPPKLDRGSIPGLNYRRAAESGSLFSFICSVFRSFQYIVA